MRAAFAGVAAWSVALGANRALDYQDQPKPAGIAHWIDLTFLAEPGINRLLVALFCLALPFYAAGVGLPIIIGIMLAVEAGFWTFNNSQGFTGHTTQAVSLVLLAQWLASLWAFAAPRGWRDAFFCRTGAMNRAMDWSRQMLAACYVVSAVGKLIASRGLWVWETPLIGLQLRKTNEMQYYSTLEPVATEAEWLSRLVLDNPWLTRVVMGAALPLELFAFFACFNRRLGLVVGLLLIAFHSTVSAMMNLGFGFNKNMIFIFYVNAPFWLFWAWRKLSKSPAS
jgi:hypothetical protein